MKRIYDFGRRPSARNYTVADLKALKGSGRKLSMSNPANAAELRACVEAGIDLLVVWAEQIEEVRQIAPHHFAGVGSTWAQFGTLPEIMDHAFEMMRKGGDMYYTLRSYDVMEALAKEGIPVQSHIGLIPTFSHYSGGLRAFGRTADEAMEIYRTLKRMEDAGVFAVEAECIAEEVLEAVNGKTSIVTFSLGSGKAGDVIMSFVADICGEASEESKPPKHAHAFGNVGRLHRQIHEERVAALNAFHSEVAAANFPYPQTNISMHPDEKYKFLEALDKAS
ncbi:3-methyl-2-oxobutanoate hydroxymethyltransferase [Defluviimonas sp. WL0024]|uniref:3-methyl-2-oxobutanoate hydroxymethyltransferase n=1 Tax=Albidovulum salinarum TaxID=2984153 RepID=A0ABT2X7T4_9RHOB|nr:3-methyl-2-oxobutanoate hydroxymethyltransferase [Defluviimonas sp. WL0024]MCU9850018.1 3-methyl-2-oxobutanoate hydroxymethyltransferase [Defluviimonas sp. WL0024]